MRFVLTAVVMLLTVVSALGREWKDSTDEKPFALTLVRDGQAASVIVTNGRPEEGQALAAAELQEHIRLMSVRIRDLPTIESCPWTSGLAPFEK